MKIRWLKRAEKELNDQLDCLEARNPRAARKTTEDVQAAAQRLLEYPLVGRLGRVPGTRELVVPRTPYILIYRVDPGKITVVRTLHGARAWPEEP